MGHDYGVEILGEDLLGRTLRQRGICTGGLQPSDLYPTDHRSEGVAGEEKTVLVAQERGVSESVSRRSQNAEACHVLALVHYAVYRYRR